MHRRTARSIHRRTARSIHWCTRSSVHRCTLVKEGGWLRRRESSRRVAGVVRRASRVLPDAPGRRRGPAARRSRPRRCTPTSSSSTYTCGSSETKQQPRGHAEAERTEGDVQQGARARGGGRGVAARGAWRAVLLLRAAAAAAKIRPGTVAALLRSAAALMGTGKGRGGETSGKVVVVGCPPSHLPFGRRDLEEREQRHRHVVEPLREHGRPRERHPAVVRARRPALAHLAAERNAMRCDAMRCDAMQCNAMRCHDWRTPGGRSGVGGGARVVARVVPREDAAITQHTHSRWRRCGRERHAPFLLRVPDTDGPLDSFGLALPLAHPPGETSARRSDHPATRRSTACRTPPRRGRARTARRRRRRSGRSSQTRATRSTRARRRTTRASRCRAPPTAAAVRGTRPPPCRA